VLGTPVYTVSDLSRRCPIHLHDRLRRWANDWDRINLPTSTTVYVVVESAFATSTMTVDGFIRARRPR
jgi:hypothetical protein